MPSFSFLDRFQDHALLLLRLGVGGMVSFHGYPLFMGGAAKWAELGQAVSFLGLSGHPAFWGFMAATAQFFGGMFVGIGFATRIASLLLVATFAVAAGTHFQAGDGIAGAAHALELAVVFAALVVLGPGKVSVDAKIA